MEAEAICAERVMSSQLTKRDFVFNYETVKIMLYHVNIIS